MFALFDELLSGRQFLGIEWHAWKVVGWLGNLVFFSRFLVQWFATEKRKQVVVPQIFWWLSLIGSLILLAYSIHRRESVFIFAYAFTWIPYIRNIFIHRRYKKLRQDCAECSQKNPPESKYCSECGAALG